MAAGPDPDAGPGPDPDADPGPRLARLARDLTEGLRPPPFERVLARARARRRRRLAAAATTAVAALAVAATVTVPRLAPAAPTTIAVTAGPAAVVAPLGVSLSAPGQGALLERRCGGAQCVDAVRTSSDGGRVFGPPYVVDAEEGASHVGYLTGTDTLYAYGPGLYVSTDAGRAWAPVAAPGTVEAVATSARDVWVLTLTCPAGTSAGCHQELLAGPLPAGPLSVRALDPVVGGSANLQRPAAAFGLALGASPGGTDLAATVNAGRTWATLPDPCGPSGQQVLSALSGTPAAWLFCGADRRLYFSPQVLAGWPSSVVTPFGSGLIEALTPDVLIRYGPGVPFEESRDAGVSWTRPLPGVGFGALHLLADGYGWTLQPGTGLLWVTTNGGLTWTSESVAPG